MSLCSVYDLVRLLLMMFFLCRPQSVRSNLTFLPVFVPITLPSASVNLQASPFRLDTFTISGVVRDFAGAGVSRVNVRARLCLVVLPCEHT